MRNMVKEEKSKGQLNREIKSLQKRMKALRDLEAELKRREEALREIEARYKMIVRTFPDIICEVDTKGRFTFVSNAIKQLGYNPEELIGKHIREIVHRSDFGNISRAMLLPKYKGKTTGDDGAPKLFDERRTRRRITRNLEVRLALKNKEGVTRGYCCAEVHSSGKWDRPVEEKEKNFLGSIGVLRDITERKKAEEALKESESKLRAQKKALEQKNIALQELLEQIGIEKKQIKDDVITSIEELLLPILRKVRINEPRIDGRYIDLLQRTLEEMASSFGRKITEKSARMTPREIEICNMIRGGLRSKEIAELTHVSVQTVESHRNNIRKKLGISNKRVNLASFLKSL